MEIREINNDQDYRAALAEIESLRDAPPGSDGATRRGVLLALVAQYESRGRPKRDQER